MLNLDTGPAAKNVLDLHTLHCATFLAACGKSEKAGDSSKGGFFTQCLLEKIRRLTSDELVGLTYKALIKSLEVRGGFVSILLLVSLILTTNLLYPL